MCWEVSGRERDPDLDGRKARCLSSDTNRYQLDFSQKSEE